MNKGRDASIHQLPRRCLLGNWQLPVSSILENRGFRCVLGGRLSPSSALLDQESSEVELALM
jgi:hypothetical protein